MISEGNRVFFKWAVHTKRRWLQAAIYWSHVPVVVGLGCGTTYAFFALVLWLVAVWANLRVAKSVAIVFPVLFLISAIILCLILLDKLFRYRAGDLLLATLSFCPEDVSFPHLTLRRGTLVVELRMGEFYNFAKYWPLRLRPSELVPFVFLDTYKGVLNLIEQVKAGTAPIDGTTPLMSNTTFLRATNQIPRVCEMEEVKRTQTFLYRLALALSLRMNPFSSRIPIPRATSKRAYARTQALVDQEQFFRDEVARLSQLTQKILQRKECRRVTHRRTAKPRT